MIYTNCIQKGWWLSFWNNLSFASKHGSVGCIQTHYFCPVLLVAFDVSPGPFRVWRSSRCKTCFIINFFTSRYAITFVSITLEVAPGRFTAFGFKQLKCNVTHVHCWSYCRSLPRERICTFLSSERDSRMGQSTKDHHKIAVKLINISNVAEELPVDIGVF